jgi:hypothetical protein
MSRAPDIAVSQFRVSVEGEINVTQPLTLEAILTQLPDDDEMWVLQDRASQRYVIIPDSRYPGRRPIRFFMKREDAESLLSMVLEVNERLRDEDIIPIKSS